MKKNKTAIQIVTGGLIAGAAFLCAVAGYLYGSRPTVGVLDVARIREEGVLFQKVALEQQKYEALLKNQVAVIQDILENDIKKYKEQEKSLSQKELEKAKTALEEKAAVLQSRYRAEAAQIKAVSTRVIARLDVYLNETMKTFAAEKGYRLVLPKGVTVFSDETVDATAEFVRLFNEKTAAVSYGELVKADELNTPVQTPIAAPAVVSANEPSAQVTPTEKPQKDDASVREQEKK